MKKQHSHMATEPPFTILFTHKYLMTYQWPGTLLGSGVEIKKASLRSWLSGTGSRSGYQ
jgi:hypothetical protein